MRRVAATTLLAFAATTTHAAPPTLEPIGAPALFAPGVASTRYAEIRLTLSPDGRTAVWFSRDRPGGAGGYDLWISHRDADGWNAAQPLPFNSPTRDFDPAFSPDGAQLYFCSDRPGGAGGDDLYRVALDADGFGPVEHLGATVNSDANEFAPMPSPDGTRLLFSSDRRGGAGGHDLYVAPLRARGAGAARPLPGAINSAAHEFDPTFLADGRSVVFARAPDFGTSRVDLYFASPRRGRYDAGTRLAPPLNHARLDSYGAMLDWSDPARLLYSARRESDGGLDLYRVRYRLARRSAPHTSAQAPLE
jgi:TolB protein